MINSVYSYVLYTHGHTAHMYFDNKHLYCFIVLDNVRNIYLNYSHRRNAFYCPVQILRILPKIPYIPLRFNNILVHGYINSICHRRQKKIFFQSSGYT